MVSVKIWKNNLSYVVCSENQSVVADRVIRIIILKVSRIESLFLRLCRTSCVILHFAKTDQLFMINHVNFRTICSMNDLHNRVTHLDRALPYDVTFLPILHTDHISI